MNTNTSTISPTSTNTLGDMNIEIATFPGIEYLGKDEKLGLIVQTGIGQAIGKIRERYEENENPADNLAYHNSIHTFNVIQRVDTILKAIHTADPNLVSKRDIQLGKLAAAYHDTVQKWEPTSPDPLSHIVKRKRFAGENEEASYQVAAAFMNDVNQDMTNMFSDDDRRVVHEAILATVPGFNGKTVIQPNLHEDSSVISRVLAIADINTVGIDGISALVHEGDALFREENIDILDAIRGNHQFSPLELEAIKNRILPFSKFQMGFAEGRKEQFETEIAGIPSENAKKAVRSLFPNYTDERFHKNIEELKQLIAEREVMSPENLMSEVGYQLPRLH